MDLVPIAASLLPPVIGGVAGHCTGGEWERRVRVGVRVGVGITVVAVLGLVVYGAYLLLTAEKPQTDLLVFVPILGLVWTLFIGLYAVGTATMGAVIGGYSIREGT